MLVFTLRLCPHPGEVQWVLHHVLVHEDCVLCGPVTLPTSYNLHSHGLTRRGWGRGHNSTHKGAWQLPALCCLLPASCSRRDRTPRCGPPPGPHLLLGSFRPRAHHPEPRGPREDEAAQVSGGGGRCRPGWGLMESRGPPLGQVGTKAPARKPEWNFRRRERQPRARPSRRRGACGRGRRG